MAIAIFAPSAAYAVDFSECPRYTVDGEVKGNVFTAQIYLENAHAWSGMLALKFDSSKLQLADASSLDNAVTTVADITMTPQALGNDIIISQTDGRILLAWYVSGVTAVDATSSPQLMCTIDFNLQPGVSAEDFDASTLHMFDVRTNTLHPTWRSGAEVMSDHTGMRIIYIYNYGDFPMFVDQAYPGADTPAAAARQVTFQFTDLLKNNIPAQLLIDGKLHTAAADGSLTLPLTDGLHTYLACYDDLEIRMDSLQVSESGTAFNITLQSNLQVTQIAANALKIGYADGDSADHVTSSVVLPIRGVNQTWVTWSSSDSNVIDISGNVFEVQRPTTVTLTATVTRMTGGGTTVTRDFVLTVLPKNAGNTGNNPGNTPDNPGNTPDNPGTVNPLPGGQKFTDLGNYPWAEIPIYNLVNAGIINGYGDTFRPQNPITRADYICLLMRMLSPNGPLATVGFTDVAPTAYYYKEVMQAKEMGVTNGMGDGTFLPGGFITRQDMILMTYRIMEKLGNVPVQTSTAVLNGFADGSSVAQYAAIGVAASVENGWIKGSNNRLNPRANCTRAEAAVFLERIYQELF